MFHLLREMRLTRGASPFTYICLWLTLLDGGLRSNPTRVGFDEAFVGWSQLEVRARSPPQPCVRSPTLLVCVEGLVVAS